MIVLVHQLFLFAQSVYNWLKNEQRKEEESSLPLDEYDGLVPVVEEELVQVSSGTSLSHAAPLRSDASGTNLHVSHLLPDLTPEFLFLNDIDTISYIKSSKAMFIMRGLPGSGKSSISKTICQVYGKMVETVVCSADDYFMKDGKYMFDHTLLSYAHESCQEKVKTACENAAPVIVVDNTNVRRWEMGKYLDFAFTFNYVVLVIEPITPWKFDAEILAMKNTHQVTKEIIASKIKGFEEVTPLYYGWFLNEQQSEQIYDLGRKGLFECRRLFPHLGKTLLYQSSDFSEKVAKKYDECCMTCKEWYGWHFPEFNKIVSDILLYAKVVKLLGSRKNIENNNWCHLLPQDKVKSVRHAAENSMGANVLDDYIQQQFVLCDQVIELAQFKDSLEKYRQNPSRDNSPKLTPVVEKLLGYLLSSNTESSPQKLFDDFKLNSTKILHCTAKFLGTKKYPEQGRNEYPQRKEVQRSYGSVHNLEITRLTLTPRTVGAKVRLSQKSLKLYEKPDEKSYEKKLQNDFGNPDLCIPPGTAAHFTIGTAHGVQPKTTNDDILLITGLEMSRSVLSSQPCDLGVVTMVTEDMFVIDLSQPISVQGLFTGFYGGKSIFSSR